MKGRKYLGGRKEATRAGWDGGAAASLDGHRLQAVRLYWEGTGMGWSLAGLATEVEEGGGGVSSY